VAFAWSRSRELEQLPDGAAVVISEGETARDALVRRGIPAVGTA
jgi:hypothetical protein